MESYRKRSRMMRFCVILHFFNYGMMMIRCRDVQPQNVKHFGIITYAQTIHSLIEKRHGQKQKMKNYQNVCKNIKKRIGCKLQKNTMFCLYFFIFFMHSDIIYLESTNTASMYSTMDEKSKTAKENGSKMEKNRR